MRSIVCLALLAAFVGVVTAADADSKVVVLDEKSFDKFVADTPLALIEFFAPWCGHCKQLAPEFAAASLTLASKNGALLASVDCTEQRDLCERFGVQGFPTLKIFRNDGSEPQEYDGPRKADGIVKFMERQNAPAVSELADAEAVKNFAAEESIKIVAFVNTDAEQESFTKVAKTMRNEFSFGVVKGNAAANAENKVTAPAVVMFRNFDEGAVTFSDFGDADSVGDKLTSFIRAQSFPLVGEIGPENYAKYLERGFNFVWIFVNPEDDAQKQMVTDITPVAAQNRDKLSFVKLDGIRWVEHAKSFGLSGNTPGVVLEARDKRKNFVFPEADAITKDSFGAWIDGVLSGKVQPNIKSEPIPEKNDEPVKVIVGKTFDEIVLDNSKDVLVEFYAPWCGHCKSLTPKYDELGKLFKDDPTVVIAKIDATANDSPADVQGFPTIILYPAGDKTNPVNYEGERTTKAMANFVKANGKAGGRPDASAAAASGGDDEPAGDDGHGHDHDGHDHDHDHAGHDHGDEL